MSEKERVATVRVFDNDLSGSQGLHHIAKAHPEVFVQGGIMERGNFSAAAGFGSSKGKQGIFSTFSAFLEMCISEITMSRLNFSNVLAHFSHSGVDDMADNTCHFGINSMYADGGVTPGHGDDTTRLYFPADQHQFAACLKKIYPDPGLRFLFSNRSAVPDILDESGKPMYQGKPFEPGKDTVVRDAKGGGYVVAFGECVYRALDAIITLGDQGTKAGLINKATLNLYDEDVMKKLAAAPWVLVVEGFNVKNRSRQPARHATAQAWLQRQIQQHRHAQRGVGWFVAADGLSGSGSEGDRGGDQEAGVTRLYEMIELNFPCNPALRKSFKKGTLGKIWAERYPQLFDAADQGLYATQHEAFHFYEWLGAIPSLQVDGLCKFSPEIYVQNQASWESRRGATCTSARRCRIGARLRREWCT